MSPSNHAPRPSSGPDHSLEPDPAAIARQDLTESLRAATLGEFEVHYALGQGGMATVFLAHDIALDRPVAIKVMSPYLLLEEGMAERFRREARTAAQLSHPHIIPVYSVRQSERLLYFVMKYVEGRPLDQIIREFAPLPLDTTQRILAQVAAALSYAHRRGVVHRDIKPANIMIDVDGWAIVADFGIARVAGATGLTSTGSAVGTPHYMSPEQYSSQIITGSSDQYSLGVVAYEMLTGRLPFPGRGTGEVMRGHLLDEPPDISALRNDCPPSLARVVRRMLEKDQDRRWPSLEEAIAELRLPQAPEDDPVRTGLIRLAKSGPQKPAIPHTPASPVPLSRGVKVAPGQAVNTVQHARWPSALVLAGLLAVAGAATVWWVSNGRTPGFQAEPGVASPPSNLPGIDSLHRPAPAPAPSPAPGPVLPPASRQPQANRSQQALRPLRSEAKPEAADTDTVAAPAPAPASTAPQFAWVYLGTKNELAFVYLNGIIQRTTGPSLRWWRVPAGRLAISVAAEGCVPWDTIRTIQANDSISIGNRQPNCNQPD